MPKYFVTYEQIHEFCQKISGLIKKDQWQPDCMVAIAGGGLIPSRILRTFLKVPIYVVGLRRYDENDQEIGDQPQRVQWLDEPATQLLGKKVLLVDEIDDTRRTLAVCVQELNKYNLQELRIAVLYKKNKPKKASLPARLVQNMYYGQEIKDDWVVYPWEAVDIVEHNQFAKKSQSVIV
ncbi:MAG: hypothetical protein A2233_01875 [Candidatus Kerfeldbacteria bacterium RIFOXYA2_FULL_38_24]|uniref:Phosphoribosyltransferase domain-containing protein n=1 Tax=Candidatus Kerfeldbacteria bacterium RIFOXYB2_FULL_38_14 TaxID=1798547 RepID=A0A1G2BF52_9BACT|nr:MAG: hypothetical protein A2319_04480 [Candidatus Kerfeldbacteria bacterium RIFOXYB2_FULL_38_14]OGY87864.1 MAG: hypothetical protein A2233_01875 [Candidatus Kerfeldbacteria bacterium RIFOXYA2_FULL_38_24]OGY88498.1 MAG: hypothetical protein A2458_01870 [Candidatus Kerfeldbacteria bacterium RIFOXYC2_FULL_38_9]